MSSSDEIPLAQHHIETLAASGVSQQTARIAKIGSLTEEQGEAIGMGAGMLIPYFDYATRKETDFFRLRLDEPGKAKYLQKPGTGTRLYFPPNSLHTADAGRYSGHVFIVEGEKKALSLSQRIGHNSSLVVGLGGVWNWGKKQPGGAPRSLIEDFKHLDIPGCKFYIVFDSDVTTNSEVRRAESELSRSLSAAGATVVRLCTVPSDGGKVGLDDYLVKVGDDWRAAMSMMVKSAVETRVDIPRIYSFHEMTNTDFPPPRVILGDTSMPLINSGGLCFIHSASGVGKTYFTMQMAHALSTGQPFLRAIPVEAPKRVVLLQAELTPAWFQRRCRGMEWALGQSGNMWVLNGQMNLAIPAPYGKYSIDMTPLELIVRDYNADVVIVDPLQGYLDIPENSTDVNREFHRRLSILRHKYDCAVIMTHHDKKDRSGERMHHMRGSSAISDWCDSILSLEHDVDEETEMKNPNTLLLHFDKVRHAEGTTPDTVTMNRIMIQGKTRPWLEVLKEREAEVAEEVRGNPQQQDLAEVAS